GDRKWYGNELPGWNQLRQYLLRFLQQRHAGYSDSNACVKLYFRRLERYGLRDGCRDVECEYQLYGNISATELYAVDRKIGDRYRNHRQQSRRNQLRKHVLGKLQQWHHSHAKRRTCIWVNFCWLERHGLQLWRRAH